MDSRKLCELLKLDAARLEELSKAVPVSKHGKHFVSYVDHFWSKVDRRGDDECWEWTGPYHRNGYGKFHHAPTARNDDWHLAHRLALELTLGRKFSADEFVLHACDNPPCCNPKHLRLGTAADNVKDRERRGRSPRGERHYMAKLTDAQVDEIRRRYMVDGPSALAQEFGTSRSHIWRLGTGRSRTAPRPILKTNWLITDGGDQDVRALADRHYSRQSPGAQRFTRRGENIVLISRDGKAAWIVHRPCPGKAVRYDGADSWECSLFRNEGSVLSSELIIEATELTCAIWGLPPKDGLITFVNAGKVQSSNPGFCFIKAGWYHDGESGRGLLRLRAPAPSRITDWQQWDWKGNRGEALRKRLEFIASRRTALSPE